MQLQRDELLPTEVLQLAEQSEEIVKKSAPASVPVLLLMMCASMTFYVMFLIDESKMWLQSFMGMAVLQLLPLVVLKLKIWTAPERLSLTPVLLEKTFLMHLFVMFTRSCSLWFISKQPLNFRSFFDPAMCVAGLAMLHKVFGVRPADAAKHADVAGMVGFSFALSFVTSFVITGYGGATLLDDAGNFADILAFVPVALLVCVERDVESFTPGTVIPEEAKQKAYHFFAFIALFYIMEDILEPWLSFENYRRVPGYELSVVAHVAHFVMLVDFVGYFLCKTWFPATEKMGAIQSFEAAKESAGLLEADEEDQI